MPSLRILYGSALVALALTLAACDDATGPVLSNEEIIAQMKVAQSQDSSLWERGFMLTVAISALTGGSPATQGTLVIGGKSHPFSFTGVSTVREKSDGSEEWVTYVIGWRHPDGDTLVALIYYGSDIDALRRTPGLVVSRLGGSQLPLGEFARMIGRGQGTISKEVVPRLALQEAMLYAGDDLWGAFQEGITGGSVAFSDASAECENIDSEDFLAIVDGPLVGCDLRKLSMDGSVDFHFSNVNGDPPRVIDLPALSLVGPIAVSRPE